MLHAASDAQTTPQPGVMKEFTGTESDVIYPQVKEYLELETA